MDALGPLNGTAALGRRQQQLLAILCHGRITKAALSQAAGAPPSNIRTSLLSLQVRGFVDVDADGLVGVTDAGVAALKNHLWAQTALNPWKKAKKPAANPETSPPEFSTETPIIETRPRATTISDKWST
jgi:hypothetical protein